MCCAVKLSILYPFLDPSLYNIKQMQKILLFKGSEIHYSDYGSGHPVLLIHGFGETGAVWDRQVVALKEDCRVLIADLPGSGRSGMLDNDRNEVTIDDYAAAMHALVQHEGL